MSKATELPQRLLLTAIIHYSKECADMRSYIKPCIEIHLLSVQDVITASGTAPVLINKGEGGEPMTESFSSMFGN